MKKQYTHITHLPVGMKLCETPLPNSQQTKPYISQPEYLKSSGEAVSHVSAMRKDKTADTNAPQVSPLERMSEKSKPLTQIVDDANKYKGAVEICIWHEDGSCKASGLQSFVKKDKYDGKSCKCFAYTPEDYRSKR